MFKTLKLAIWPMLYFHILCYARFYSLHHSSISLYLALSLISAYASVCVCVYIFWVFLALTMNIQTNGIFRCTDTVLVLQFARIVAHIGAQHLLYFQADAIHIAAIHSIIFDNYRLAILFPAEHTNKNKNLCRRIKRFNNSSPTMNFSFLIDFHSGEIAPENSH